MRIAYAVSEMATCPRKHVGAVLVDANKRIVATGFNGSPAGMYHCTDVGCYLKEIDGRESCIQTLHAESNAIDYAGRDAAGCTLYTTVFPCFDCSKRIVNARIKRVIYDEYYESRMSRAVRDTFGGHLEIEQIDKLCSSALGRSW